MKTLHLIVRILTLSTLSFSFLLSGQAQRINIPDPVLPPANVRRSFDLDPFYQQWIDVGGFPVIASEKVNPYAVKEAAYLIHQMLEHRPDILQAFVQYRSRFTIIGYTETITQIPEYSDLQPDFFVDIRNRGLGTASPYEPASGSEENLLHYPGDPYEGGSVLIHEFAHLVHLVGLKQLDPGFDDRLKSTYVAAMAKGLWKNSYAVVNEAEYWAEGVGAWFHGLHPDDAKLYGGTRKDLETYDSGLAALLKEVFGDGNWRYTPVTTRLYQPHLQGFNPQNLPTFQWPPETLALNKAFTSDPESTGDGRWVNLPPYPPSEIPRLQALRNEGDPTTIFIANFGIGDVYVYRVEPDRTESLYNRLYHGHRVGSYNTHVGSLWLLKDENGKNLAVYRAESETGRILILPNVGTKIEGPWLWMIAPTQYELLGSEAAASGMDYLAIASDGAVKEQDIATNGAIAGTKVGNKAWTSGKLAPIGGDNITEMVTTIGLTKLGYIEYHVAYGSIALEVPREQKTVMHVGSDDAVKVWLNGTLVHEKLADRGANDYQDGFPVTLKQGKNLLLVAVYQGWGGWSGFFGFETDAEYSILPPPMREDINNDILPEEEINNSPQVKMPDANLAAAVRQELRLAASTPITEQVMQRLTTLGASDREITNLTGLEHATGLVRLSAWENQIQDVSPLSKLTQLQELHLQANQITDITAFAGLTELRHLHLWGNRIRDISALAGLTKLESLWLAGNPIQDKTPLHRLLEQNPDMELDIEVVGVGASPAAVPERPAQTALLANYPNPFNPETWIPYQLAKAAEVTVSIYSTDGKLVRTLALGHLPAGVYRSRSRAAYWDGKTKAGETVASGVYFYTLEAGEFTATRKMLILK